MLVRTVSRGLTVLAAAGVAALAVGGSAGARPAPDAGRADAVAGRVLVKYAAGASASGIARTLGAKELRGVPQLGLHVLSVPAGAEDDVVQALQHRKDVVYAERDSAVHAFDVTPNDPYWPQQWSTARIHAPAAWTTSTGSSAVTVAVLDTGLNSALPEFAGRVRPGYNVLTGTSDTTDDNSHGTAAAGVALAQGNNATGVAGMCWQCSVLPVKVLDANGNGTDSNVAAGITWAVDHGAKVLSLSLGSASGSTSLASAVSYARSHGALVVAAAGNNGTSAPTYPAAYSGVVSVAASDQSDALYGYSEYGSWISVAAPGTNYSVWPSGSVYSFGGTSSATPVVAGLAGALWAAAPTASADDVAAAITSTTTPLTAGVVASGRVDAAAAMAALTGAPAATPTPAPTASASPAPSASPSPAPSPTSTAAPATSPSPTTATGAASGSLPKSGVATTTATTSGGTVTATVTSASGTVTLSVLDAAGRVVASSSGTSGTKVTAVLGAGRFTVQVKGAQKTRWGVSFTYPS